MNARKLVVLLVVAIAAYGGLIGYLGVVLIDQPRPWVTVLGVAIVVLPLIGVWAVFAEIRFGQAMQRLGRRIGSEPAGMLAALPRRPSGRIDRAAADEVFEQQRRRVEAAPSDWREWYRLAITYDAAGDRRRARESMRRAITLGRIAGQSVD
ncbi:MAG: hypothetical protein JO147_13530 [Actinobacteria bacterium]|nr:hypothetical protein [Actinomycetota bacterium]